MQEQPREIYLFCTDEKIHKIKEHIKIYNTDDNNMYKIKLLQEFKKEDLKKSKPLLLISGKSIDFRYFAVLKSCHYCNIKFLGILDIHRLEAIFNSIYQAQLNTIITFQYLNPIELINNQNINQIIRYIDIFMDNKNDFKFNTSAVKGILFRGRKELSIEVIDEDLEYLHQEAILTARLAIFIYKLATFDFFISDTMIGSEYKKVFGKSKNFTNKKFHIANVKCYDLRNNGMGMLPLNCANAIAYRLKSLGYKNHEIQKIIGYNSYSIGYNEY